LIFYFEKACPLKMGSTNFTPPPPEMADPPPPEKNLVHMYGSLAHARVRRPKVRIEI
jgi:hypothetical protein